MYTCTYEYVYTYAYVYTHLPYICIHVKRYMSVGESLTQAIPFALSHNFEDLYIHMHTYTYTNIYTHTHTHTYIYI